MICGIVISTHVKNLLACIHSTNVSRLFGRILIPRATPVLSHRHDLRIQTSPALPGCPEIDFPATLIAFQIAWFSSITLSNLINQLLTCPFFGIAVHYYHSLYSGDAAPQSAYCRHTFHIVQQCRQGSDKGLVLFCRSIGRVLNRPPLRIFWLGAAPPAGGR